MEETFYTSAIILKRTAWRENDSKVIVYSLEKGKLELVARGTKKILSKLAGHLEPITLSDLMVIKGRQVNYIGTAISEENFQSIKSDLRKIAAVSEIIRLFDSLVKEQDKDLQLFYLLRDFLFLADEHEKIELVSLAFKIKLVAALGYAPDFDNCLVCSQKNIDDNFIFDFVKGGVVCSRCKIKASSNIQNFNASLLTNYRMIFSQDLKTVVNLNLSLAIAGGLRRFIDNYILANIK